ncbi:sodium-coupled monocarboxylate transporter 1-like isoform X3 [Cydia splendana]|uniref:sodium-coupled monocarboxylate transporter 1-like isoform X3 n=1 Tax=Cydia splendana TaxID=1100963 RepID=UPI00212732AD
MDDPIDVSVVRKSFQHFSVIDYSVFVLMLGVCTGIGLYFGCVKKQKSAQDYLMGGRDMGIVPVTFSLVASFISGISLLGTPTELYLYGTSYVFFLIGACLMSVVISFTFMPVLHDLQITSAYEYLELRYDKRVRLFGSIIFSFYLMAWLPIVIYVPALAFNQVTGVNIHIVTPIVCFVCIFYTSLGGLKAVVWTDVIQTIVMTGAMILVIIKGTIIVGGLGEVWRRNWNTGRIEMPSLHFDLTDRHTIWSVSIGSMFYWTGNIAVNQSMMQRFLSLPDLKSSKRAVWGFLGGIALIVLICAFSGMLAYARYYDCDPLDSKLALAKDQILPLLVMDVLGEWNGLPGIFVAGVFSAALSSLSTGLNSMSAVVLEDFWKPFFRQPSHKETQILMRAVVVVIGCVCVERLERGGVWSAYFLVGGGASTARAGARLPAFRGETPVSAQLYLHVPRENRTGGDRGRCGLLIQNIIFLVHCIRLHRNHSRGVSHQPLAAEEKRKTLQRAATIRAFHKKMDSKQISDESEQRGCRTTQEIKFVKLNLV